MSTFSHTDWTVTCDGPGCLAQLRTDQIGGMNPTAADVRKSLKRRGWAVNVRQPSHDGLRERRLDFCPKHKPDA